MRFATDLGLGLDSTMANGTQRFGFVGNPGGVQPIDAELLGGLYNAVFRIGQAV